MSNLVSMQEMTKEDTNKLYDDFKHTMHKTKP